MSPAKVGDTYAFTYPNEPQFNKTLRVVDVKGDQPVLRGWHPLEAEALGRGATGYGVKLTAEAGGSFLDIDEMSGLVHQIVVVTTVGDKHTYQRRHLACGLKVEDTVRLYLRTTNAAPNCIVCLAQSVYRVKCRRGACGKWQHPEAMGIHRDTLEAYCVECAAHITQANKDGTLVQMWALLEQEK